MLPRLALPCFGFISGPVFHRYDEGYQFAKLACDLVEKHGFIANRPKVYHAIGDGILLDAADRRRDRFHASNLSRRG